MKVYVITNGMYSDYHICCVCLDREGAERRQKLFSDSFDEAEIEEFDTDEYNLFRRDDDNTIIRIDGKHLYSVDVFDNGDVNTQERQMYKPYQEECWYSDRFEKWTANVFGRNEKEAEKRAFDLIAQRKYGIMEERGDV